MKPTLKSGWFIAWVSLLLLFAGAVSAAEDAGKILFGGPGSYIIDATGNQRDARRGEVVRVGDTLVTTTSRLQATFSDGGMISLLPGTELKVTEYHFAGTPDGSEKGVFNLVKGGLRSITGAIGKGTDKDAYRMETPVATIGIRGTEYAVQIGHSIEGYVFQGVIQISNRAGSIRALVNQGFYVKDLFTLPVILDVPPVIGGAPAPRQGVSRQGTGVGGHWTKRRVRVGDGEVGRTAERAPLAGGDDPLYAMAPRGDFQVGELLAPSGVPVVIPLPRYTLAYVGQDVYSRVRSVAPLFDVTSGGRVLQGWVHVPAGAGCTSASAQCVSAGTNRYAEWGTTANLALARWSGGVTGGVWGPNSGPTSQSQLAFDSNSGLHSVIGMPMASLPPLAGVITYEKVAATAPTDGINAPGTLDSAVVKIDFSRLAVAAQFVATVGGATYDLHTPGFLTNAFIQNSSLWNGQGPWIAGRTGQGTLELSTSGAPGVCGSGCSASIHGFLSGPGAGEIGAIYAVKGADPRTAAPAQVSGAAILAPTAP